MFRKILILGALFLFSGSVICAQTHDNQNVVKKFLLPTSCKAQKMGPNLSVYQCPQPPLYDIINQIAPQENPQQRLLQKAAALTLLSDLHNALSTLDSILMFDTTALPALQLKALVCEQLEVHQNALESIYEAIVAKPELGEELWIEIQVLRNKMTLSKNPEYNLNGSLISLDFGSHDLPKSEYAMPYPQLLEELLQYAQRRFTFYSADSLSNALILYDLGNLSALSTNVNDALVWYKLAKQYRFESYLLEARIKKIEGLNEAKKKLKANELNTRQVKTEQNSTTLYLIAGGIAAIIVAILALVMRKKVKINTTTAND